MNRWISFCSLLFLFLLVQHVNANNLSITSPVLTGIDAANNFAHVKFDVSWENSWRTSSAPNNWDAAWVFVKYKVGSGEWQHATLNSTGHTAASGSTVTPSSDGKGAFIYRNADGTGSVNFTGVKLRWNYGTDGVSDDAQLTVKVFGIEMVYVPQVDSFKVGSGSSSDASFTNGSWTTGNSIPFKISSEDTIQIGQTAGKLWAVANSVLGGEGLGSSGTLAAAFPKGFAAFYCMKYSISQEQYKDFLNMLTYTQQATRTATAPNSSVGTLAMSTGSSDRNGIRIMTSGTSTTVPAVYGCDASENGTFNEAADGQNLSCNWLSWSDGIAFSDWTGLRPMSELEFEKACRGPVTPVAGEFIWGNTSATAATATTNNRQADEIVTTSGANANFGNSLGYPIRVGIFAGASTTRSQSGATYYGVMDVGGDVLERVVTIQNTTGRSFTGTHGDGALNSSGNMNGNSDWPGTDAVGAGFRGGPWDSGNTYMRISDRTLSGLTSDTRGTVGTRGFRSVRTAP